MNNSSTPFDGTQPSAPSRRAVLNAGVWSVPVVAAAASTPAASASTPFPELVDLTPVLDASGAVLIGTGAYLANIEANREAARGVLLAMSPTSSSDAFELDRDLAIAWSAAINTAFQTLADNPDSAPPLARIDAFQGPTRLRVSNIGAAEVPPASNISTIVSVTNAVGTPAALEPSFADIDPSIAVSGSGPSRTLVYTTGEDYYDVLFEASPISYISTSWSIEIGLEQLRTNWISTFTYATVTATVTNSDGNLANNSTTGSITGVASGSIATYGVLWNLTHTLYNLVFEHNWYAENPFWDATSVDWAALSSVPFLSIPTTTDS